MTEYQCVSFLIPVGWWNKANLIGAFMHMTNAYAWSETDYGSEIAEAWKLAFYASEEEDFMLKVTNDITVNCGGCGSCTPSTGDADANTIVAIDSASQQVEIIDGENTPPINTVDQIPQYLQNEGINTVTLYDEWRCRQANWIADKVESNINFVNETFKAVTSDFTGSFVERAVIAIKLALSDSPSLGFGDVIGLIFIVSPKLVSWLTSAFFNADSLIMTGLTVDKPAIVSRVYHSSSGQTFGDINAEFIYPVLQAAGLSQDLIDLLDTYNRYIWGSRFGNWFYSSAETLFNDLVPSDYPIGIPCDVPNSGSILFTFPNNDWEGWYEGASSYLTTHDVGGWGLGDNAVGDIALLCDIDDPNQQVWGNWRRDLVGAEQLTLYWDGYISLWQKATDIENWEDCTYTIYLTFTDLTTAALNTVPMENNSAYDIVNFGADFPELVGKTVSRISIVCTTGAQGGGVYQGSNGRFKFDQINLVSEGVS